MPKTRKHSVLCVNNHIDIDISTTFITAFFILRFSLNLVLTADGEECNGSHPTVRVSTRLGSVLPVRKYTQWIPVSGQSVLFHSQLSSVGLLD